MKSFFVAFVLSSLFAAPCAAQAWYLDGELAVEDASVVVARNSGEWAIDYFVFDPLTETVWVYDVPPHGFAIVHAPPFAGEVGSTYQFSEDYDDDGFEDNFDNCPFSIEGR